MFRKKILLIEPCKKCWPNGYIVHQGSKETSINKTTIHTLENNITPNQKTLEKSFRLLVKKLKSLGCDIEVLPFPNKLDDLSGISHSVLYVRDVGFSFENLWIKSNFSAKNRQKEADVFSEIIKTTYDKKIITLPKDAEIEFGEVHYIQTKNETFYFGGISRANRKGQEVVKDIIQPDNFFIIESLGFHLDTVFTPVVNKENNLVAVIIAKGMITPESYKSLEKLKEKDIEIINIDNKDSCDVDGLGTYAVNCLVGQGFLVSGSNFVTDNVIPKLNSLDITFHTVGVSDYQNAGGSVHCITNELYL